jgi:DNA polymerase-4
MSNIILHIDFDSFFASVEQQYNPSLRGKPIGVTASNGRTAIIAASREAKKRGIKSPSSTYTAKEICPEIQFVKADFVKYWDVSKKFIGICKDYTPYLEVFSIDELFMDITLTAHLFGGKEKIIAEIKRRIREEIGEYITVSIGISENKLLAKLASGWNKPNGHYEITKENLEQTYQEADLTDICGIGPRIQKRLNQMGIYTLLGLRDTRLISLIAEFGHIEGTFLKQVGLGLDTRPVVPYTQESDAKSIGRQYCLPANQYDEASVLQNVYELCEELGIKLRRLKIKARRIHIYLSGSISVSVHKTSDLYVQTGREIFQVCLQQITHPTSGFYDVAKEERYVRRIGITVSLFEHERAIPEDLFGEKKKQDTLTKIIDTINTKFGDHTIRNGFLLYADKLTTVPNGFMADRYERQLLTTFGI